jgi:peptidoglycan/xylan/chitin deacetylase (PgdA/CDA1 family)
MLNRPDTLQTPRGRWRPAPAIQVSIGLHALGAAVLVFQPGAWPWVLAVLVANHLVLSTAVLWPRGRLLGPNLVRLAPAAAARGEIALTFDDGPDPQVTPRVLDLLDQYGMKASFFCIGIKAQAYPEIVKDIARRGHSVENHSHRHSHGFAFFGLARLARDVEAAQATIAGIVGCAPRFFRAPGGFRSPLLDPVLARRHLRYASWTRRSYDTVRTDPHAALSTLTRGLAAGDVLLLHDGSAARTAAGIPMVLAVLPALLDTLSNRGLKSVALPSAV